MKNSRPDSCHLCGAEPSTPVRGFETLPRITSDCKPWPSGGHLYLCHGCGTIHKNTDAVWLDEISRIYRDYTIYYQSGGVEQPVFVPENGELVSRSKCLLDRFRFEIELPASGRLIDVGCGNGSFLRTFNQIYPGWSLVGTEFNDKYKTEVESVAAVEAIYTGSFDEVPGMFDVASLIHVMEHIPWPGDVIDMLHHRLRPQGLLILDLPDYELHPFDFVVADHCSHFTESAVTEFLRRRGFEPILITSEWIKKERVVIARRTEQRSSSPPSDLDRSMRSAGRSIAFLQGLINQAVALRDKGRFGIFGTSIAGTWLAAAINGQFDFWVEQDVNRVGKMLTGKPIIAPADVPPEEHVLLALSPTLASLLGSNLNSRYPLTHWHLPAALTA